MFDTVDVWDYDDIQDGTAQASATAPYPIQLGDLVQGITVYNISPFWLRVMDGSRQTMVYIAPWYFYPITSNERGRIYIKVDDSFPVMPMFDPGIVASQKVYCVISSQAPYSIPQSLITTSNPLKNIPWRLIQQFTWEQLLNYLTWQNLANQ